MIRASATPADERKKKIEDALTSMQFNTDPHLREFGITIESKMAQVTGRVLPAPKLAYGIQESNTVIPKDGVWHMKNVKFVDARSMTHFGVMNITRCQEKDINTFLDAVYRLGREMGTYSYCNKDGRRRNSATWLTQAWEWGSAYLCKTLRWNVWSGT